MKELHRCKRNPNVLRLPSSRRSPTTSSVLHGEPGTIYSSAPVAQRIERWFPKPGAQVRVLAGAHVATTKANRSSGRDRKRGSECSWSSALRRREWALVVSCQDRKAPARES